MSTCTCSTDLNCPVHSQPPIEVGSIWHRASYAKGNTYEVLWVDDRTVLVQRTDSDLHYRMLVDVVPWRQDWKLVPPTPKVGRPEHQVMYVWEDGTMHHHFRGVGGRAKKDPAVRIDLRTQTLTWFQDWEELTPGQVDDLWNGRLA